MSPHWPYRHDQNCNYKKFKGKTNFEGYKNSYLCIAKRIEDIIKIIDEIDNNAIVIVQSDHSWECQIFLKFNMEKECKFLI